MDGEQVRENETKLKKLVVQLAKEEASMLSLEHEFEEIDKTQEKLEVKLTNARQKLNKAQKDIQEKAEASNDAKKKSRQFNKDLEGQSKSIAIKSAQIERLVADKFSILKKCQFEEISLPLEDKSVNLRNISFEMKVLFK